MAGENQGVLPSRKPGSLVLYVFVAKNKTGHPPKNHLLFWGLQSLEFPVKLSTSQFVDRNLGFAWICHDLPAVTWVGIYWEWDI